MKPIKVLVVNEDEIDFKSLKDQFSEIPRSHNYVLSWSNCYEKAINSMLKSQYDAYLVYYRLGLYTGVDLLNEAVKSNVAEPIIMVSETDDHILDEVVLQKGASDCLIKQKTDAYTLERSIRYTLHHKKILKQVKENEYKFRTIFERSPDPILITDNEGNIHDINPAGEKFLGTFRVNLLKSNASKFYKNSADRMSFISEIEQKGTVTNFIVEVLAANGEIKRCSISSFLQISQHGNQELFHTVIHDLSNISDRALQKRQLSLVS